MSIDRAPDPTRTGDTPHQISVGYTPHVPPPRAMRGDEFKVLPYDNGSPRVIFGMSGFGDSLYMRPVLRHFPGSYLRTPYPWLFADLGLRCMKAETSLRTQAKAIAEEEYQWQTPPVGMPYQRILYRKEHMENGGVPYGIQQCMGVTDLPYQWDVPKGLMEWDFGAKVAIVRPVTLRTEWHNAGRNCLPEYVATAATILSKRGYLVISVADLQRGHEWALTPLPAADVQMHSGEIGFRSMLGLVQSASVCVGTPGWLLPACLTTKTPMFCIAGGVGGHNAPDRLAPNADNVGWAIPDEYCMCYDEKHACPKHITGFDEKFKGWLDARGL